MQPSPGCKSKAWNIQAWTGHDIRDTGAVLYQLSYQANWDNWELLTLRVMCS